MDYNIPSYITPATIVKAAKLVKNAKSINYFAGKARWNEDTDNICFMFTNKYGNLILVHCCPHSYFVEKFENLGADEGYSEDYSMVTNVRHLIFWLRKSGYYDCEHLKKDEDLILDVEYTSTGMKDSAILSIESNDPERQLKSYSSNCFY